MWNRLPFLEGEYWTDHLKTHEHLVGMVQEQLQKVHADKVKANIEHQLSLSLDDLAEEDRFLLECNFDDIKFTTGEAQGYWLLGIQAAREASRIRREAREEAQIRPRKCQRRA